MLKTFRRTRFSEFCVKQASCPSLAQLSDSILQLAERRDRGIRICWPDRAGGGEFQLLIQNSGALGTPFWELQLATERNHDSLWNHVTCDALLMHNLIATSCGAASELIQAESTISKPEAYRFPPSNGQEYNIPYAHKVEPEEERGFLRELIKSVESAHRPAKVVTPKSVDPVAIQAIRVILRNPQSDLLFYPAFLYELEQEYVRSYRNRTTFSVLILQFRSAELDESYPPKRRSDIVWIAQTISNLKRASDLVAHYEGGQLCMLLPNTSANGATKYAKRLTKRFQQAALSEARHLSLSTGYASLPEQCSDLGMLLALAEASLAESYPHS